MKGKSGHSVNSDQFKDKKKSRTRETPNLSTDADSSTYIFGSAGVKKGGDSISYFFYLSLFYAYLVVFSLHLAITKQKMKAKQKIEEEEKNVIMFDKSGQGQGGGGLAKVDIKHS